MAETVGAQPTFATTSAFWIDVRSEIASVLAKAAARGHPTVGDPRLHGKALFIVVAFLASYVGVLLASGPTSAVVMAMVLGVTAAAMGFSVFHDAGHGTFSRNNVTNHRISRLCAVMLGPSRFFWDVKHHRLHHRAPNLGGWDDDVDARGWLRLSPEESWSRRYTAQHIWFLIFYGLNTIEWFFIKDFGCLWRGRLNCWQQARPKGTALVEFWLDKALWFALFVLPPFMTLPLAWAVAAFFAYHLVFSLVLTLVFQLAHLTPGMAFGRPRHDDDNASHQLRTTANFATDNVLVTWFTGALNYQIEHHLLPGIAHTHYPALAPIVASVASRYGLPYHDLGSLRAAIQKHFMHIRRLGLPVNG
jgi:linoleoyl-CoA desaturase